MTRFLALRMQPNSPGQAAHLEWRVVGVDRDWCRVDMPSPDAALHIMRLYVGDQLGSNVQLVVVDVTGYSQVEHKLHPDVYRDYKSARAAEGLQGVG